MFAVTGMLAVSVGAWLSGLISEMDQVALFAMLMLVGGAANVEQGVGAGDHRITDCLPDGSRRCGWPGLPSR